ncbi:MAG: hypothetical protein ABI866_03010 [Dokdonella sp.]
MSQALARIQIVQLSGADAKTFAQSQFSSDVNRLMIGTWQWSAWLDASGKVRNTFALLCAEADLLLAWLPLGDAETMASALRPFIFRSKVVIAATHDHWLFSSSGKAEETRCNSATHWMLEMPGPGKRSAEIVKGSANQVTDSEGFRQWQCDDIAAGLPWIAGEVSAQFTSQALGLHQFGAISVDKGCYPGQETVARLHFRGGNKRERAHLRFNAASAPAPGESIHIGTEVPASGKILYAVADPQGHCDALAILPIGLAEDAPLSLPAAPSLMRLPLAAI